MLSLCIAHCQVQCGGAQYFHSVARILSQLRVAQPCHCPEGSDLIAFQDDIAALPNSVEACVLLATAGVSFADSGGGGANTALSEFAALDCFGVYTAMRLGTEVFRERLL